MFSNRARHNDKKRTTVRSNPGDSEANRQGDAGSSEQLFEALGKFIHFDDLELEITMADIEADLRYGRD